MYFFGLDLEVIPLFFVLPFLTTIVQSGAIVVTVL